MNSLPRFPSARRAQLFKRLSTALVTCMLLVTFGCAETDEPSDEALDAAVSPGLPNYDAGSGAFDAGSTPSWTLDASSVTPAFDAGTAVDASTSAPSDASVSKSDAAATTADGGGFMIPDLGSLFPPAADAGATPASDAGTGVRNVKGPCKDLNLLCFDFVDMWINAECATCNDGKGCQGCAIPYAY